jgi:murein DD-endopeptidase MepM/ murein hydrolase activator NlpD
MDTQGEAMNLIHPVSGARVSSQFGVDRGSRAHGGTDFAAACGTPVVAAAAGRVSAANYSTSAGNLVHIKHGGGVQTKYFHLQRSVVGVGAQVAQGQLIGCVGNTGNSTGCHLHFEVRVNGVAIDPIYALQNGAGGAAQSDRSPLPSLSPFNGASLVDGDNAPLIITGVFALLLVAVAARR